MDIEEEKTRWKWTGDLEIVGKLHLLINSNLSATIDNTENKEIKRLTIYHPGEPEQVLITDDVDSVRKVAEWATGLTKEPPDTLSVASAMYWRDEKELSRIQPVEKYECPLTSKKQVIKDRLKGERNDKSNGRERD